MYSLGAAASPTFATPATLSFCSCFLPLLLLPPMSLCTHLPPLLLLLPPRQLSYPDEAHGLVGLRYYPRTSSTDSPTLLPPRPHFYHALTDFLLNDCFGRNEVISG